MRTVSVSGIRPAGQAIGGEMAKLPASAPRGAIGTGLLLLISLFLLLAGSMPAEARADSAGARPAGAFLLDPLVGSAAG